jgi:transcriptional regulator with GAF, ATPase, and Fis domain|tara:strand:+ start:709 stop:927 length:219 start_codon:yes stop_codon:yes gene_type:complete
MPRKRYADHAKVIKWSDLLAEHNEAKKSLLKKVLNITGGSQSEAARDIGMSRQQFNQLCKRHGVTHDEIQKH